jgi:phosphatidate cytidylyltransferase
MKRILTALVLIVFVGLLVFLGKLWMIALFAAIVAGLAAFEFRSMAAAARAGFPLWWMIAAIALFFITTFLDPSDMASALSLSAIVLFGWSALRSPLDCVLGETSAGLLMLVYIAFPLTLLPLIWTAEDGTALLLFLFLCVWSGDIAALYVGKRFGKRKLAPRLSPNKTWEGAIASVVGSVIFGVGLVLLGDWFSLHDSSFMRLHTTAPWWEFLVLAVVLNVAAQFGDLLESAIKRGVGVKDSGTILPGHGGVLDRIDALLLAAPVLWFVMEFRNYMAMGSL